MLGHDRLHQLGHAAVVAAAQAEQADLLEARLLQDPVHRGQTSCTGRSRTGRKIMPAWQKRQPRVQPRWISMAARLWTVSMNGTMNPVVGGGITGRMRFDHRGRRGVVDRLHLGHRAVGVVAHRHTGAARTRPECAPGVARGRGVKRGAASGER